MERRYGKVSWIKLNTNIFSNRKVALLLNERDGYTYFKIWIQLLTIAGQCNVKGKLIVNDNIPISVQQLAKILGKSTKKVKEILDKFIELGMIIYEDDCIIIKNWCKYQSADKLDEIQKNNRERQRKFSDKTRLQNNVIETLK